nr:MAG TPA: hypothetical protein [Caudoviricetes sp.]
MFHRRFGIKLQPLLFKIKNDGVNQKMSQFS